jgi:GDP-D-mannose 3',5'-epimerase
VFRLPGAKSAYAGVCQVDNAICASISVSIVARPRERSHVEEPLNLGSDRLVTINQLVDIVEAIAGVQLRRRYLLDAPKSVRGRNSDNTLIQQRWAGRLASRSRKAWRRTYRWIHDEMVKIEAGQRAVVYL